MSEMEDHIREMEEMTEEELYQQFFVERPRFMYYEGPISVQTDSSFWGVRLDGVGDGNFPEDCVFLDDVLATQFHLPKGPWTEPAKNRYRIIIERLEETDE